MTKFYGLTGGIGAGKSAAMKVFKSLGVATLDLDKVGKDILLDKKIQEQLVKKFGFQIIREKHHIDTKKLRDIAFQSQQSINDLNHIMHPAIWQHEKEWRKQQDTPLAVIEASALIESGKIERMDGTIIILADLALRQQRVLQRGNHSLESFQAIVDKQCSDKERRQAADYMIYNNGTLESLKKDITQLLPTLVA